MVSLCQFNKERTSLIESPERLRRHVFNKKGYKLTVYSYE